MIRPNGMMINVESKVESENKKRYNVAFLRNENGEYSIMSDEYIKTSDPTNLNPFVNWLDIPGKVFAHPIYGKFNNNTNRINFVYYDTFHVLEDINNIDKKVDIHELYHKNLLPGIFDKLLDSYTKFSDEKLLEELNYSYLKFKSVEEFDAFIMSAVDI